MKTSQPKCCWTTISFRLEAGAAVALTALCWLTEAQAVGDVEFNDPMISSGSLLYSPILTSIAVSAPFLWTSAVIEGNEEKLIMQARDDAALYVATALTLLRDKGATQSDQVLAHWILIEATR